MYTLEKKRQQDREYRKNLGEIYRARQREHYKKYRTHNREKELGKERTYRELRKLRGSGKLKSIGNVDYHTSVFSPNGTRMAILKLDNDFYFKIREFVKAVGYSGFTVDGRIGMAMDAKNADSKVCYGYVKTNGSSSQSVYLINFTDVINVLNRLIKIVNSLSNANSAEERKAQETQFESQRMIEWFNEKILPQYSTVENDCKKSPDVFSGKVFPATLDGGKQIYYEILEKIHEDIPLHNVLRCAFVSSFDGKILQIAFKSEFVANLFQKSFLDIFEQKIRENLHSEIEVEAIVDENLFDKQTPFQKGLIVRAESNLQKPAVVPKTCRKKINSEVIKMSETKFESVVPVVTVADIEDIGERADKLKDLFDVSKKDALRASVQLKSQEINRDLSPLLDLVKN